MSASELLSIGDRAAIVGIGQTRLHEVQRRHRAASGGDGDPRGARRRRADRSTTSTASPVSTSRTSTSSQLVYGMGIPHLRFFAGVTSGGGAVAGTLVLAAMAVATGPGQRRRLLSRPQSRQAVLARRQAAAGRAAVGQARRDADRPLPVPRAVRPDDAGAGDGDDLPPPHARVRHHHRALRRRLGRAARARGAQSRRRDARADHARRPPGVALDRRAPAAARLLPGDRRRLRGDRHLGRARPRLPAARRPTSSPAPRPKGRSTSRWPTTWRTGRTSPPVPTSPSSSTRRPASRRATSTPRCSSTTSARRSSSVSRTTASARAARAARSSPPASTPGRDGSIPVNTHGGQPLRGLHPRLQPHPRGRAADPRHVALPGERLRAGAGDQLEYRSDRRGDLLRR